MDTSDLRALVYMEMYDVLEAELGMKKAEELLTRAIYRRGKAMGRSFAKFGPADLEGLQKAFLGSVPGGEAIFKPQVLKAGGAELGPEVAGEFVAAVDLFGARRNAFTRKAPHLRPHLVELVSGYLLDHGSSRHHEHAVAETREFDRVARLDE